MMKGNVCLRFRNVYNHFTAIVWNNTNSLGCAYKSCDTTTNLNAYILYVHITLQEMLLGIPHKMFSH